MNQILIVSIFFVSVVFSAKVECLYFALSVIIFDRNFITLTIPCILDPLVPHFYIVKTGIHIVVGVHIISQLYKFLICLNEVLCWIWFQAGCGIWLYQFLILLLLTRFIVKYNRNSICWIWSIIMFVEVLRPSQQLRSCRAGQLPINTVPGQA